VFKFYFLLHRSESADGLLKFCCLKLLLVELDWSDDLLKEQLRIWLLFKVFLKLFSRFVKLSRIGLSESLQIGIACLLVSFDLFCRP